MQENKLFEQFLLKARQIHGDLYDYSQVKYVNNKTKIVIKCNRCGLEFEVRPDNHLNKKSGCPICNKQSHFKKGTEQFINQLKDIYGDKFDYSKVEYNGNKEKVCVICPKHGEFWQLPTRLLKGISCPKCSANYHLSKEEVYKQLNELYPKFKFDLTNYRNKNTIITFWDESNMIHKLSLNRLLKGGYNPWAITSTEMLIQRLKEKFGEYYNYSKVKYYNRETPITLIVSETKEEISNVYPYFLALKKPTAKIRERITTEIYILRCKKKYGDLYDYSQVEYINPKTKITIICPIHGAFQVLPFNFLYANGCPKCNKEKNAQVQSLTLEGFIDKANKVHNNIFDYSKVNYKNNRTKVCIICPKHGEFWQEPSQHLMGSGCPKCKASKLEKEMRLFFQEEGMNFEEQKHFEWLGKQSLDFYLPQYNIAIECQGKQHFGLGDFGSKRFNHTISQQRDERKRQLCELHGIKLLYYSNLHIDYPYKVYEDKNELLKEVLNN